MYCKYCGSELDESKNLCINCGKPINETTEELNNSNNIDNLVTNQNKQINKNKKIIIIALISILVIALLSIFLIPKIFKNNNPVAGKYNCKTFNLRQSSDYSVSIYLNNDNSFVYGPYNDIDNNHYKGTYTYEDEKKSTQDKSYNYYMITFKGNELVEDGKKQEDNFNAKMEFGIKQNENNKKEGITIFTSSYNMYYCYEE